jgi:hypothetical protein
VSDRLEAFRQKNPAYKGMDDEALATAIYTKFYNGKVDRAEFDKLVGLHRPTGADGAGGWSYRRPDVGMAEGATRGFFQGQTFNFGDEITAALAATASPLVNENTGDFFNADHWNKRYETYLDRERSKVDQFREDQPVAAIASEVAGGVTTGLAAGAPAVAAAPTLAGQAARGAFVGGTMGGLTGFGDGRGGAGERAENAIPYAAGGAAIGGAVPFVLKGGKSVWDYFRAKASRIGADEQAVARIYMNLTRDGLSPEDAIAEMERRGASLVDLGPNTRRLGEKTVLYEGPALTQADEFFERRAADQFGRAFAFFDDAVDPETVYAYFPRGEVGFNEALDRSVPLTQSLRDILSEPAIAKAYKDAVFNLRSAKDASVRQAADALPDDIAAWASDPSIKEVQTRLFHQIKGVLDTLVNPGRDHTGAVTAPWAGRIPAFKGSLDRLRNTVRMLNPDYDRVLKTEALVLRGDEALKKGADALKRAMTPERIREQMFGMTDIERRRYQLGFIEALETALDGRGANNENVTRQILAAKSKIEAIFGDKAGPILDGIRNLRQFSQTANTIMGGSPTARRLAGDSLESNLAGQAVDAIQDNGQSAIRAMFSGLRNLVAKPPDAMLEGLGRRLFTDSPASRAQLLAEFQRARSGANAVSGASALINTSGTSGALQSQ